MLYYLYNIYKNLKQVIKVEENIGPFVCGKNVFNRILRLEKRRGSKNLFLVISFDSYIENNKLEKVFDNLILLLRSKDVITKSKTGIFVLLNNADILYGEDIVNRFNSIFEKKYPDIKPVFTLKNF